MSGMTSRTACIFDAHPLWLDALQALLERLELVVVGRASGRAAALAMIEEHRPDVIVADLAAISHEASDGVGNCAVLLRARAVNPDVKSIVLSNDDDDDELERAFNSGASVFCVKSAEPDDLAQAIRQSFNHSIYFAPRTPNRRGVGHASRHIVRGETVGLTNREVEILRLAADGYSNSRLAQMLCVTDQTVKFHLSNIYRKLGVANRTEASRWAQRNGVVAEEATASA